MGVKALNIQHIQIADTSICEQLQLLLQRCTNALMQHVTFEAVVQQLLFVLAGGYIHRALDGRLCMSAAASGTCWGGADVDCLKLPICKWQQPEAVELLQRLRQLQLLLLLLSGSIPTTRLLLLCWATRRCRAAAAAGACW